MKIAVIGYSGAGKSTMAKRLGELHHCAVLHLDRIQFEPDWKERDRESARTMVAAFMRNRDWVIDGNYTAFFEKHRLREADLIVFLDFSRAACFWQALCRYRRYRNKTRDDMAAGCIEKMDVEFIRWLLLDGRTKERQARFERIVRNYRAKTVVLKNRRQADLFLRSLNSTSSR